MPQQWSRCHVFPLWELSWRGTAGDVPVPWSAAAEESVSARGDVEHENAEQPSSVVLKDSTLTLQSCMDCAALCPSR